MKIKYNGKTDTFSLKGLDPYHLEVLFTLLNHTRLGDGIYENAAFEMLETFEQFQQKCGSFTPEDCTLDVEVIEENPIINLSHFND